VASAPPPISPLRTGIEDVGVRFAAQPDPSESSEGHLLDLGAVVIEATPSQLGRLAIIQNSFNFPPGRV